MSQIWLITGSSRGLGLELAKAVLEAGHRVVATARRPEQLQALVAQYGDRVTTAALDVTDPASARAAVKHAVDTFGRLDVVVNNAGYGNIASIEEVDESDFRAQIETNFFGAFHVTRAALPVLREQRAGHIIQVSSIGGRAGTAGLSGYQSAKWALEGFSEVLHSEVAPLGIKVTIVEPGGMRTDWAGSSMTVNTPGEAYRSTIGPLIAYREAGKPLGDPAKAAQVILEASRLDMPPIRLLLGSDAVHLAERLAASRAAEDAKWRTLSISTDADDADAAGFISSISKLKVFAQSSET